MRARNVPGKWNLQNKFCKGKIVYTILDKDTSIKSGCLYKSKWIWTLQLYVSLHHKPRISAAAGLI